MITDDMLNHLANMTGLDLPVYVMQFPEDTVNCVVIFIGTAGGVGSKVGFTPMMYTKSDQTVGYIDYPGIQIQVRYTDPHNAYRIAESIRTWLDDNLPTGYLRCDTKRSQPVDFTNTKDLEMIGGPAYRFAVDFALMKVRT